MRYMLDANAFILLLTGHRPTMAKAAECEEGDLAISAIAFADVAHGTASGKAPPREVLARASDRIEVLPFDTAAAQAYADLAFKRGSFDRLVAAHALSSGLVLVTANLGDFADVPGLRTENWAMG